MKQLSFILALYLGFLTIHCSARVFSCDSANEVKVELQEKLCSKNSTCCQQTNEQNESENSDTDNGCNSCERCCCYCCGIIISTLSLDSPEIIFSTKLKSRYSSAALSVYSADYFQPPEI